MSNKSSASALVLRWQELRQQGQDVSAAELCAHCPELLDDVKRHIHVLASMNSFLGISSGETPGTSSAPTPDRAGVGEAPKTVAMAFGGAASPGEAATAGTHYRPLRLHAQGGLGEVFVALDEDLSREVALKRIRRTRAADAESRRRFLREGEITGNLEHPGVVPVYGLTRDADGQPCYVMRFIRGQNLKEAIERYHTSAEADRGLALRQLLTRFVAVCNTLAYAHSKGIVHRDLKPANIMLGDYGETLVVDWGLAKRMSQPDETAHLDGDDTGRTMGEGSDGTATGDVLGTPAFMSPEQAAGDHELVGPSTDIYGLGATLYALLTGKPPIDGDALGELLRNVERGDFAPPRTVRPEVSRALEAICLKAMAREPAARYATALELAADLERWLGDDPVRAYREPVTARARRWARRHKSWVAAGSALLLTAMVLGCGSGLWLMFQRAETRRAVTADLDDADRLQLEERWSEARAVLERADGRLGGAGPADLRDRVRQVSANLALVDRLEEIILTYADPTVYKLFAGAGRAADSFAGAFSDHGLDLETLGPDAAAERVKGSAIRRRLLAALEEWAYVKARTGRPGWEHLLAIAERVDSDPWRLQLREAWVRRDRPVLRQMIAKTDVGQLPPESLAAAGRAMGTLDYSPEIVQALRDVQRRVPSDVPTNRSLATQLYFGPSPKQKAEAVAFYRAALAQRPNSAFFHIIIAQTLVELDDFKEAEAVCREVLRRHPDDAEGHNLLGWTLWKQGKTQEAEAEYGTAIGLIADCASAHNNLAFCLAMQGKEDKALHEYEEAVRSDPNFVRAREGRCRNFFRRKEWVKAEEAAIEWIKIEPESVTARLNLTMARKEQGHLDDALTAIDEALTRLPTAPALHCTRGEILLQQGKDKEAGDAFEHTRTLLAPNQFYPPLSFGLGIIAYQRGQYVEASTFLGQAVADTTRALSDSSLAIARYYLGLTSAKQGNLQFAVVQFQTATKIKKDYAEAHCQLGLALRQTGQFAKALESLRKGHELGSRDPKWAHPSADWIRETEHRAGLERSLGAIISGKVTVADADLLTVAQMCQNTRLNAAAAKFYSAAFAAQPKLADEFEAGDRYNAARAAALAGCGTTNDGKQLDEQERARLRRQALDWLRADLALAAQRLDVPDVRAAVRSRLAASKANTEFQAFVNPVQIAKLPKDEHEPWLQLWADADALVLRAQR
jgi:eukaryotic-like serine/threonine-protein kinase